VDVFLWLVFTSNLNRQTTWLKVKLKIKNLNLVWSRGRFITLQTLTSSSFSLVEGTHGSSGQCVSFSLIDVA